MKDQSGFTLIEVILYIGLFVLIMSAVILATYNMIASTDKSQYRSLMHNEGQFVIRKFESSLDNAQSIAVAADGSLDITNADNSHTIISRTGSKINLNNIPLNGDIAPAVSLDFSTTSATHPAEVTINFEMKNIYYDETFNSKKLVR